LPGSGGGRGEGDEARGRGELGRLRRISFPETTGAPAECEGAPRDTGYPRLGRRGHPGCTVHYGEHWI